MISRGLCAISGLAALSATACAVATAATVPPPAPLLPPAGPVQLGSDSMTLLRSGPLTFTVLAQLIAGARQSVDVEVYEFGQRGLADVLIADAHRGVAVTVIDDPSELASAATATRLRQSGVTVVDYPVRRLMIDHVKLLVVDHRVAVVGGINWGVNSPWNHDYDAELR